MQRVRDVSAPTTLEGAHAIASPPANAPRVLIQYEGRSVMSSARRRRNPWVLRGESAVRPPIDPLMGWVGDADTHSQIKMRFSTLEAAMAFARRRGWRFDVVGATPAFASEVDDGPTAAEAEQAMFAALAQYAWLEARYGDGELAPAHHEQSAEVGEASKAA